MEQELSIRDAALEHMIANLDEQVYADLCKYSAYHESAVDAEREDDGGSLSFLPPLVGIERPDDESEFDRVKRLYKVVVGFATVAQRIVAQVEDEVHHEGLGPHSDPRRVGGLGEDIAWSVLEESILAGPTRRHARGELAFLVQLGHVAAQSAAGM